MHQQYEDYVCFVVSLSNIFLVNVNHTVPNQFLQRNNLQILEGFSVEDWQEVRYVQNGDQELNKLEQCKKNKIFNFPLFLVF